MKIKQSVFLTKIGVEKLKEEYNNLKNAKIAELAIKIKNIRDSSTRDTDYDMAMEELMRTEARIEEIKNILSTAVVIDNDQPKQTVDVGAQVLVENGDEHLNLQIVGTMEANPSEGKISNESPLGRALLGGHVGAHVQVATPLATSVYKIVEIR